MIFHSFSGKKEKWHSTLEVINTCIEVLKTKSDIKILIKFSYPSSVIARGKNPSGKGYGGNEIIQFIVTFFPGV